METRGGKREGAGRKPGSKNKLTIEALEYAHNQGKSRQPIVLWFDMMWDESLSAANRLRASENIAKYVQIPAEKLEELQHSDKMSPQELIEAIKKLQS